MSAAHPAVALQNVTKRYGPQTALHNITFEIPEHTTLALLGPNGAGKSTLLKLIATLAKPSQGQILIQGIDTKEIPEQIRSTLGLISHQTMLYDDLTARENLTFYARMYGLENLTHRIDDALQTVDLQDRQKDRVRTFSRGMKQRLTIARATLHDPSLLLLDEPFTGLDTGARSLLSTMLQTLQQAGRTLILVTHDLAHALALADHYAILNRGHLITRGQTQGLTTDTFQGIYEGALVPKAGSQRAADPYPTTTPNDG